jgi:hypothetical protein
MFMAAFAKPLLCAGRFISTKFKIKTMEKLADGFEVSARSYYYLLDWNEVNEWEYITHAFLKTRLCDLTKDEYTKLFDYATLSESNGWKPCT